jgi:leucyl-tRNA synthetase
MTATMRETYQAQAVEAEAQAHWSALNAFRAVENDPRFPKGKYYVCSMLPYPSGKAHMGHVLNYTLNDIVYRYKRASGYNVMTTLGWDSFGLPSENAAIERGIAPAVWTRGNIADMKSQFQPLGLAFDWSREVSTCDPSYYKWNQWFFLKMLEKGIAYRRTQVVNWDPVDNTVLANEQVVDGRGWRSGAIVEKREIPGYYLAITKYADALLDEVQDGLEHWPSKVRTMQANWIGRSHGVNFGFPYSIDGTDGVLRVYTTRADTIMGVTFVALAAEHPLATRLARDNPALAAFIEECKKGGVAEADIATMEKKGMATGFTVNHPLTGAPTPVWVGNYVLMGYGEGAVMAVPGHDERDFAFAQKYGLPIQQVIAKDGCTFGTDAWQEWYADKDGVRCVNSGKYDGLDYAAAVDAVATDLRALGLGDKQVNFRLRDWGISRQRYWGTPIPIIHCEDCGAVPVPEADLPVILPEHHVPDGSGNPLNRDEAFLACTCPTCGKPARRETDTMDTFVDSAWYYMRYCCADNDSAMVDARNDYWMPMDQYIGGIEHAVLHLLYARFWTRVMRELGLVSFDEPFSALFTQGMLLAECFYREDEAGRQRWYYPSEVEIVFDDRGRPVGATAKDDGQPVKLGGIEKMSKSKNNVVEPKDIIAKYGADTARAYVMFMGPPDEGGAWVDSGAAGVARFFRRMWAFCHAQRERVQPGAVVDAGSLTAAQKDARRELHMNLKRALYDYERTHYNTVVSGCMKTLNALEEEAVTSNPTLMSEGISVLLGMLYPIAPHITHALWRDLGYLGACGDLLDRPMPTPDESALVQDEIEMVVQLNGKLRGSFRVPAGADKGEVERLALADATVEGILKGAVPKRVVVVPGKLVNLVV